MRVLICCECIVQCCYFEVQITLIVHMVWSEQSASFVLSGFRVSLLCFIQTLCMYGCMYFLAALELVCVDAMVMSSA